MVLLSRKTPRLLSFFLLLCFIFNPFSTYLAHAQTAVFPGLPLPNQLLATSSPYSSPVLKGIRFNPTDPLKLEFIIDTADQGKVGQDEAAKLVKYFLAGLTLPENDLWVNLSPYEANRVIPQAFSQTDLGKDLLGEDYILKQLASSLTYPETELGKKYWDEINNPNRSLSEPRPSIHPANGRNTQGAARIETTQSFNRVWIIPDKATIYENKNTAFITESSMKVMTEEDYLAEQQNYKSQITDYKLPNGRVGANNYSPAINAFKTHILPAITQEVNQGQNFACLRQIYNALMLAVWFKDKFKQSFYKSYIDQKKISGIDINDKTAKEKIYNLYVEAFKNGVYNYVQRERVGANNYSPAKKITRRQYFSGGVLPVAHARMTDKLPSGALTGGQSMVLDVDLADDAHLEKAYANPDHVLPAAPSLVNDVISDLRELGEFGNTAAGRLRALAEDTAVISPDGKSIIKSRINLVYGIDHSHAGGMGISIRVPAGGASINQTIAQLFHEALAGNIVVPKPQDPVEAVKLSKKIHQLIIDVEQAILSGDSAQIAAITARLNNLQAEGLMLAPKPLWYMTQSERDQYVRDYAMPGQYPGIAVGRDRNYGQYPSSGPRSGGGGGGGLGLAGLVVLGVIISGIIFLCRFVDKPNSQGYTESSAPKQTVYVVKDEDTPPVLLEPLKLKDRLALIEQGKKSAEEFHFDEAFQALSHSSRRIDDRIITKDQVEEVGLVWSAIFEKLITHGWAEEISTTKVRLTMNLDKEKSDISTIFGDDLPKILTIHAKLGRNEIAFLHDKLAEAYVYLGTFCAMSYESRLGWANVNDNGVAEKYFRYAYDAFNDALRFNPDRPDIYHGLGDLFRSGKNPRAAEEFFRKENEVREKLRKQESQALPHDTHDHLGKFRKFDITEIEKSDDVPNKVTITAQVARFAQAKEETIKLAGEERRPAALRKYRRTGIGKIDDALDEALDKTARFIVIEDKVGLGGKAFQYGGQKENIIILHKSMAGDDIAQFHELAHLARVLGRLTAEDLLAVMRGSDWGEGIIDSYYTQKLEKAVKEMGYDGLEDVPEDVKFHYAAYAFQAYKWHNENAGVTAKARDLGGIDFKKKSFKIKTNGQTIASSVYNNGVSVTGSLHILNITMQAISSLQLRRMLVGQ